VSIEREAESPICQKTRKEGKSVARSLNNILKRFYVLIITLKRDKTVAFA
jgi:hypothetical protein